MCSREDDPTMHEVEEASLSFIVSAYQKNDYEQIYSTSNAKCELIWDHYQDHTLFYSFDSDSEESKREGLRRLRIRIEDVAALPTDFTPEEILESGQDLYYLTGPTNELRKYFLRWLENVVDDAEDVGGDDSYFDYYPDNFYFADQVAKHLGLEEEVQAAKKKVYDLGMYHDEDSISHGYELDGRIDGADLG